MLFLFLALFFVPLDLFFDQFIRTLFFIPTFVALYLLGNLVTTFVCYELMHSRKIEFTDLLNFMAKEALSSFLSLSLKLIDSFLYFPYLLTTIILSSPIPKAIVDGLAESERAKGIVKRVVTIILLGVLFVLLIGFVSSGGHNAIPYDRREDVSNLFGGIGILMGLGFLYGFAHHSLFFQEVTFQAEASAPAKNLLKKGWWPYFIGFGVLSYLNLFQFIYFQTYMEEVFLIRLVCSLLSCSLLIMVTAATTLWYVNTPAFQPEEIEETEA